MRRLAAVLVLASLIVVSGTLPAFSAPADVDLVAAVEGEGGEHGELPGPEPMGPNEESTLNPALPDDYEPNFLWGAAVGLLALVLFGLVAVSGLYYLMVMRPRKRASS